MTDEELIAGLMSWSGSPFDDEAHQAAARIEALVKDRDKAISGYTRLLNEKLRGEWRNELEAKLVKAVEALHFYADFHEVPNDGPWGFGSTDFGKKAKAALAELEAKP